MAHVPPGNGTTLWAANFNGAIRRRHIHYISSGTANRSDPQSGAAITGFKWWNLTFPTIVDSGTSSIGDFESATEGAVTLGSAVGEFTAAIHMDPGSAQALLRRADAFRLKGDYVQALADYSSALRLDPANALALLQRGQVHWIIGQGQEAIADFTDAIKLDAKLAVAWHNRGLSRNQKRQFDDAIADFTEEIRLDPKLAHSYVHRAIAYEQQGDQAKAAADRAAAKKLDPSLGK